MIIVLRTLYLPILGSDSLTYHAVKAGLWVQSGAQYNLNMPGGWSAYRLYSGGGEILSAWAMLPFHSDLLTGLADVVEWLSLGVVVFAIARHLGLRARAGWVAMAFGMAVPPVSRAVGACYVDIALAVAIVGAVLFGLRFLSQGRGTNLFLCLAALGVAVGIKVTAIAVAGLMVFVLAIRLIACRDRFRYATWGIAGMVAALVVAAPWYIFNFHEAGYPLSPFPAKIGPVVLGVASPEIQWFQDAPETKAFHPMAEIIAIAKLFWFALSGPRFGPECILLLVLFPLRFWQLLRARPLEGMLIGAAVLGILFSYFSTDFTVVRLGWTNSNGRFLIVIAELAAILALRTNRADRRQVALQWFLFAAAIFELSIRTAYGWSLPEIMVGLQVAFVLAMSFAAALFLKHLLGGERRWLNSAAVFVLVAVSLVVAELRSSSVAI